MILGERESTGTVDEAKDLISNEEPEKFENEVQDENKSKFIFSKQHISEKHEHIKESE